MIKNRFYVDQLVIAHGWYDSVCRIVSIRRSALEDIKDKFKLEYNLLPQGKENVLENTLLGFEHEMTAVEPQPEICEQCEQISERAKRPLAIYDYANRYFQPIGCMSFNEHMKVLFDCGNEVTQQEKELNTDDNKLKSILASIKSKFIGT